MNQREIALEILVKSISDNSYTNLFMRKKLNELEPIQRPFVTNLVYGVLKKYDYLIYQIKNEFNSKTSLRNKLILAMALYEKFFLKEKDYVVNNEYVNLANNKYDKSFINAVLRKDIELRSSDKEYINCSLPEWLYNLLSKQYDLEKFNAIINNYNRIPEIYYRKNNLKFIENEINDIEFINNEIFISNRNLVNSSYMKEGKFYIQDFNSSNLFKHLDLNKNDKLLDVCSAPGSKLFNCLDVLEPSNCYANDIHEHRVKLIKNKAELLGFNNINYLNLDGREIKNNIDIKFNKIMLDVPCSGLGTIGRKPDLKYHIKPESLDELQSIQAELLESVKDLLLEGGIILYSTCTLNKKENRKQIDNFIINNPNFTVVEDETIINDMGDCFYYAKLLKGYNN